MDYKFYDEEDVKVLSVSTLLYEFENRQILSDIESHIANGQNKLIVDLTNLKFINSVGLSFLISALTKTRNAGGELVVINVMDKINELLATTKLKSIFKVHTTMEEATKVLKEV